MKTHKATTRATIITKMKWTKATTYKETTKIATRKRATRKMGKKARTQI